MRLDEAVLSSLRAKPASGGELIERLRARGELGEGPAVLVYGALARLRGRGEISVLAAGPGERVWGPATPVRPRPRQPGLPPSFGLGPEALARVDAAAGRMTRRLPQHYFEELRRAIVSDADRRISRGSRPQPALALALRAVGPEASVRRYLARLERTGRAPPRLPPSRRLVLVPALLLLLVVLLRAFVLGIYTLPPASISMAPALIPAAEGGDAVILANLLAYRFGRPARGDVALYRIGGAGDVFVKRVMGLAGETLEIDGGDLVVDGRRLVKERALLDAVRVPLADLSAFQRSGDSPVWRLTEPLHPGFIRADGTAEIRPGVCRDIIVRLRLRVRALPCTVTVAIEEQGRPPHTLLLSGTAHRGGAYAAGLEVGGGPQFALHEGEVRDVWMTNADRLLRAELDGREVARAPLRDAGGGAVVSVSVTGGPVDLESAEVARDLVHEAPPGRLNRVWTVPPGHVFLLGDNSADSRDSRTTGTVPENALLGRLWAVVWPPSRVRVVR